MPAKTRCRDISHWSPGVNVGKSMDFAPSDYSVVGKLRGAAYAMDVGDLLCRNRRRDSARLIQINPRGRGAVYVGFVGPDTPVDEPRPVNGRGFFMRESLASD